VSLPRCCSHKRGSELAGTLQRGVGLLDHRREQPTVLGSPRLRGCPTVLFRSLCARQGMLCARSVLHSNIPHLICSKFSNSLHGLVFVAALQPLPLGHAGLHRPLTTSSLCNTFGTIKFLLFLHSKHLQTARIGPLAQRAHQATDRPARHQAQALGTPSNGFAQ
jgi:hypothetical protein